MHIACTTNQYQTNLHPRHKLIKSDQKNPDLELFWKQIEKTFRLQSSESFRYLL